MDEELKEMIATAKRDYEAEGFIVLGVSVRKPRAVISAPRATMISSIRNLRRYRRLDLDFRSLPEEPGVAAPPDGIDAM